MNRLIRLLGLPIIIGIICLFIISSCKKENTQRNLPSLDTIDATEITYNSARAGGEVLSKGDAPITELGVCLAVYPDPTINNLCFVSSNLSDSFSVKLSYNYYPDSTYYYRSYAKTSNGVGYGPIKSFSPDCKSFTGISDIDGNLYGSIKPFNTEWLNKNLEVTRFTNGDSLFKANTMDEWDSACINNIPSYCYYDFDESNKDLYGLLYNRAAITDNRGLSPTGWTIPNDEDWELLRTNFGGQFGQPGIWLKSDYGWANNGNGTNISCFTGLPAGRINFGNFLGIETTGIWWSKTPIFGSASALAPCFSLKSNSSDLSYTGVDRVRSGISVRCVRK